MLDSILGVILWPYIVSLMTGTTLVTEVLGRYLPALTPDSLEKAIADSKNELVALLRQDWKKAATVVVGLVLGLVFWKASWGQPGQIVASFGLGTVGYSYCWKYAQKWLELKMKELANVK